MSKILLMFVALFASSLLFAGGAAAQFSLPKVKLPTMPKKETPTTTSNPTTSTTSTATASSAAASKRGIPVSGARITFSNNPDGSNPKTSFSSSEYIYGRVDLGGKTVYDAFGLKGFGDAKFYYINYHLNILPAGKQAWEHDWHNGRNFVLMTKEDAQKTYWNFDVLPDPNKISTIAGTLEDDLDYYKFPAGIYTKWYNADSARGVFPQSGTYTIDITIYGKTFDDWGKLNGETDSYPTISAAFPFQFNGPDGQKLVANSATASKTAENAKKKQEMLRTMPEWWGRGSTPPDPKLAPARLLPLIKGYIGQWNLTLMKHTLYASSGPLWAIQKNSLGIPEYRTASPYIYIIYKDPKDPDTCNIGFLEMREPYAGGGTYGAPYLRGIHDSKLIDCAAIK